MLISIDLYNLLDRCSRRVKKQFARDRVMKILVTDCSGEKHQLESPLDGVLMETLRLPDYGLAGICGGVMACGTCHVYVDESQLSLLEKPSEDEAILLESLINAAPNSRLSCQIKMSTLLDGLMVAIAPET